MRARVNGQWQPTTYRQMGDSIRRIARALLATGVQPGDRVGIFSENRPEWSLVDFAVLAVGGVTVPVYATNTRSQVAYIVDETGMAVIFTGSQATYDKARAIAAGPTPIRCIVAFDDDTTIDGAASVHFSHFLKSGSDAADAEIEARLAAASSSDLATIIYTSGTTGEPKGVMLTHANLFHQFKALAGQFHVGPGDRSLCVLPLSHVYERAWSFFVFKCGAENYYLANPKEIIATMGEVRPTVMVSVPRLYEKIYAAAMYGLSEGSSLKKKLFHWSIGVGSRYQYALKERGSAGVWLSLRHKLADRLVLRKVRAVVGGPKNFFSAGGAPLAQAIEEFFFAAGLLVCEGYGLTETSPMVTCNTPGAFRFGTVGKPILDCEVKIAANGEILVRSPSLTQGYYRKPEATAEAFRDGWFHTGDVGEFDADGFLRITDRIKDLIITSAEDRDGLRPGSSDRAVHHHRRPAAIHQRPDRPQLRRAGGLCPDARHRLPNARRVTEDPGRARPLSGAGGRPVAGAGPLRTGEGLHPAAVALRPGDGGADALAEDQAARRGREVCGRD
jgi:long-chain acyl-CoA synthetase